MLIQALVGSMVLTTLHHVHLTLQVQFCPFACSETFLPYLRMSASREIGFKIIWFILPGHKSVSWLNGGDYCWLVLFMLMPQMLAWHICHNLHPNAPWPFPDTWQRQPFPLTETATLQFALAGLLSSGVLKYHAKCQIVYSAFNWWAKTHHEISVNF